MLTFDLNDQPIPGVPENLQEGVNGFRAYLKKINGVQSTQDILSASDKFGLPEPVARTVVNELLQAGDLSYLPKDPVCADTLGTFVDMPDFRVYCYPPELDQGVSLGLLSKNYELYESSLIAEYAEESHVAIDLGANIGYYTMLLAKAIGPDDGGRVLAFEPELRHFIMLQRNLVYNRINNVSAFRTAVSDHCGTVELHLNERNLGDHRIWSVNTDRKKVLCQCVSLDQFLPTDLCEVPLLIKMDIQGAEGLALWGMRDLLRRAGHIALFTEYWPWGLAMSGVTPRQFDDTLHSLGFRVSKIDAENEKLVPLKLGDLPGLFPEGSPDFTNLLCTKGH